jgi:restriction endonuclease Mrr
MTRAWDAKATTMTFTEAAVEILRLVGKPLHYKKITEIAIERNLLSHVGKTPEITMSSRLATMVKKDRGEAPILKVKPGVFGLREFSDEVMRAAEKETGHDYALPEEEEAPVIEVDADTDADSDAEEALTSDADRGANGTNGASTAKLAGEGVFPAEDDDDQPILANLDDDESKAKRKRRRRRRGKREDEVVVRPREARDARDKRDEPRRDRDRDRDRDRGLEEPRRDRDDSRRDRDRDDRRDRHGRRDRGGRDREPVRGDWHRAPEEGERVGHGLAEVVFELLDRGPDRPQTFARVAAELVRTNKLSGNAEALAPTVAAAVRADTARHTARDLRPRFRVQAGGVVSLVEWDVPREAQKAEREAERAAERQRDFARRAFLRMLSELPSAGFAELIATWLSAEGVAGLHAVRRPAASRDIHLAGTLRRGLEELRLAFVLVRNGADVGREHVIEVRGSLHHYDGASAAWIVTTGAVLSGARDECAAGSTPISLFDGAGLARALENTGIGLVRHAIPVTSIDRELLEALGLGVQLPLEVPEGGREQSDRGPRGRGRSDRDVEDRDDEQDDAHDRAAQDGSAQDRAQRDAASDDEDLLADGADDAEGSDDADADAGEEGDSSTRRRRRRRRGRRKDSEGSAEGATERSAEDPADETDGEERTAHRGVASGLVAALSVSSGEPGSHEAGFSDDDDDALVAAASGDEDIEGAGLAAWDDGGHEDDEDSDDVSNDDLSADAAGIDDDDGEDNEDDNEEDFDDEDRRGEEE